MGRPVRQEGSRALGSGRPCLGTDRMRSEVQVPRGSRGWGRGSLVTPRHRCEEAAAVLAGGPSRTGAQREDRKGAIFKQVWETAHAVPCAWYQCVAQGTGLRSPLRVISYVSFGRFCQPSRYVFSPAQLG